MRLKVANGKVYQQVTCNYGFKRDKKKTVWTDVTDTDYILGCIYSFREPKTCAACDEKDDTCEVCIEA